MVIHISAPLRGRSVNGQANNRSGRGSARRFLTRASRPSPSVILSKQALPARRRIPFDNPPLSVILSKQALPARRRIPLDKGICYKESEILRFRFASLRMTLGENASLRMTLGENASLRMTLGENAPLRMTHGEVEGYIVRLFC